MKKVIVEDCYVNNKNIDVTIESETSMYDRTNIESKVCFFVEGKDGSYTKIEISGTTIERLHGQILKNENRFNKICNI